MDDEVARPAAEFLLRLSNGDLVAWDQTKGDVGFTVLANFDIDASGVDGIVFQDSASGTLLYWNETGFTNLIQLPPNSGWTVQAIANFTGDAAADFLLFNSDSRSMIFWNVAQGGNGFTPFIQLAQGQSVTATGDFNGDGREDILIQANDLAIYWTGTGFVDVASVITGSVQLAGVGDFG